MMKQSFSKRYETPRAEVIVIECQGVLCTSAGGATATGPAGNGLQFNTTNGTW